MELPALNICVPPVPARAASAPSRPASRLLVWLALAVWAGGCGQAGGGQAEDVAGDAGIGDSAGDRGDAALDSDAPLENVTFETGALSLHVTVSPFAFELHNAQGAVVLSSLAEAVDVPADPATGAYGPPAATWHEPLYTTRESWGWDTLAGDDDPWTAFDQTLDAHLDSGAVVLRLGASQRPDVTLAVTISASENRVDLSFALEGDGAASFNRLGASFHLAPDEHFLGLGGRPGRVDHRGESLDCWVEESGLGAGEGQPPGPANPYPNGQGMTSFPVPFLLSTAGYGLWLPTDVRSRFHLGSHSPSHWRLEVADTHLEVAIVVHSDPMRTLADFTAAVGRSAAPPDWVFGPRRRIALDSMVDGLPEWQALRTEGVPTTTIEDEQAWLPLDEHAAQETWLEERLGTLHEWGFKVLGLAAPLVSTEDASTASWYAEAVLQGYLARDSAGDPYVLDAFLGRLLPVALLDLTRRPAVTWFQQVLSAGLALGYDGWRLDFADLVPADAVFGDGSTGLEQHNPYPSRVAGAVRELLDSELPGDGAVVESAGYLDTPASGVLAWAAGTNASFDPADGLPAAVRMGINLGLSGYPYYGSDIGGDQSFSDPPTDRQTYLRWTAFAALSPLMQDEAVGVGSGDSADRWGLWSDTDTRQVYGDFARLHTRLVPYLAALAREASMTGAPLMRQPYLVHPDDPETIGLDDEYFLGPALLVAPVVERDAVTRRVYFPAGRYVQWDTGEIFEGPGWRDVAAPLGSLPLFRVDGGIVPLYDDQIETVAPEESPDVIGPTDVAEWLDVLVVRSPGRSSLTLADGTQLSVEVTGPVAAPFSAGETELPFVLTLDQAATCDGCYLLRDGTPPTLWVTTPLGENVDVQGTGITLDVTNPPTRPRRIRWEVLLLPQPSEDGAAQ